MSTKWIQAMRSEAKRVEFPNLLYFLTWATALRRLRCFGVRLCALREGVDGD